MKRLAAATLAGLLLSAGPAGAAEIGPLNLSIAHSWSGIAPCLSPERRTEEAIERKLSALVAAAPTSDAVVAGVTLKDQPQPLIAAFRQVTRLVSRRKTLPVPGDCHDVGCAARAVFGAERGPRLLYLAVTYRYNASELGEPATRPWTPAELDELIAALEDMPSSLFPLERAGYRALVYRRHTPDARAARTTFELAAQAGEGQPGIVVAQGWHRASGAERRAIIGHELAHEFVRARGRSIGWHEGWRAAVAADAAAADGTGRWSSPSAYARKNLDEDFAESVSAYRYMAPLLKRRAPHRYAYLRERVFGGLEYGSAAKCAQPLNIGEGVSSPIVLW